MVLIYNPIIQKAKIAFLVAKELTNRILSTLEIADIMGSNKVAKYWLKWLQRTIDDICPDTKNIKIPKLWPVPSTPLAYKVDDFTLELLVTGCYFQFTSTYKLQEPIKVQMHFTGEE